MASAYWRTNYTVDSLLSEREVGWEFHQLVKLLLLTQQDKTLENEHDVLSALAQKIKFKGSLASDFPPNEIREVHKSSEEKPIDITLANGTLTTKDGPLPEPFIAWIKELSSSGDHAMAEFMDIFNNRLMALRYLVRRSTQPSLIDTQAASSDIGQWLYALSGSLYNREKTAEDLRLAGLLANNRMSFPVIKQLLLFSMGLSLQSMDCYKGGWLSVDKEDHSTLGAANTCTLGETATLGTKVWDQQKAIELSFDRLSWNKVKALIPGGQQHQEFIDLLKRITDCRCDCQIVLKVQRSQVPPLGLGKNIADHMVFQLIDESDKKTIQQAQNHHMSLGLTTVLPIAEKRKERNSDINIRFTVETSMLNKQCA